MVDRGTKAIKTRSENRQREEERVDEKWEKHQGIRKRQRERAVSGLGLSALWPFGVIQPMWFLSGGNAGSLTAGRCLSKDSPKSRSEPGGEATASTSGEGTGSLCPAM